MMRDLHGVHYYLGVYICLIIVKTFLQTDHSFRNYKKQKGHCSRLYKKERKSFFDKLNISFMLDNIIFKKTVKRFLSNKGSNQANIKLAGGDKLLQHDTEVAEG